MDAKRLLAFNLIGKMHHIRLRLMDRESLTYLASQVSSPE
jgi:hypothetical protein